MSQAPAKAEPHKLAPVPTVAAPAATPPNWRVRGVLALIALVALGTGGRMWYRSSHFVETENAFVSGHVHPVSARISGVVTKVLVEDNQTVKAGDVIAELDPADQRVKVEQIQAQIASAQQQVLQADAQVEQVRAQAAAASAQVLQSEAQLLRAKQDAERFGQLYNAQMKAVSKAELDAANAGRAGAMADVSARRGAVVAAQAQITAAGAARDVVKAQIKVLQTQLKDAQQQLAYNRILAPVEGRLGRRSVEVGARVQPGQQLAAIVQDEVWITANFKETQLADLHPGQSVHVVIDAMPKHPLVGRIDSFSPASGNQFALLPADNATGNFTKIVQRVPVKIVLRAEDVKALQGRLVPGMSALAEIDIGQQAPATKTATAPVAAPAAH
ncbi:HlyD family efflux transporter periplasmic adaptor subunit [Massilia sp. CCM 8733]|uniref:HlyD family efflux transporter periplasmic adaptor subunit n=1 Tax=Massilia mucilaginosa TaxID=2609282 RepID=A0ABX0NYA0_9BURK|nr:HlyD family secretion protein [Massilia mucilaginosa]NHZ91605.1 HlyD family efflux transporter periplasmic adaptor subunit [Massilia mucilaginosa]